MAVYKIYEENMPRLEKKLQTIANKCEKYGTPFSYKITGEEYQEREINGQKHTLRFVLVDVEGEARVNNWRFVASLEHTEDGNIIRGLRGVEVPKRYYSCGPKCEHCKTDRNRTDTYIVQNLNSGHFKQVGKSCLRDFTKGMSAEGVAAYVSLFDELIQGEAVTPSHHFPYYIKKDEALLYIAETVNKFGFENSDAPYPTWRRALNYYRYDHNDFAYLYKDFVARIEREMQLAQFDIQSKSAKTKAKETSKWVESTDEASNFIHNIKTVYAMEYITPQHFSLLAAGFPAKYKSEQTAEWKKKYEIKMKEIEVRKKNSNYVSEVGKRIEINVKSNRLVSSVKTQFGLSNIYHICDVAGNCYIWKTANALPEDTSILVGTVKEHQEYNGEKQTVLTRCVLKKRKEKPKPKSTKKSKTNPSRKENLDDILDELFYR